MTTLQEKAGIAAAKSGISKPPYRAVFVLIGANPINYLIYPTCGKEVLVWEDGERGALQPETGNILE